MEFYEFEEYEPTEDEMEEMDGMENTEVKVDSQKMSIEFDTANFANGIMRAVATKVKKELYKEIVDEIKQECLNGIKEKLR